MEILIDKKAKNFIKSKGEKAIEVWLEGCASWGPSEPQPSVRMGKPENIEEFNLHKVDDIDVYVKSDVIAKDDELKIKYTKILWKERLTVEGMLF